MSDYAAFAFVVLFLGLVSCVSSPVPSDSSIHKVTTRLVSETELRSRFGRNSSVNPYLSPSSLFFKDKYEFVVIAVEAESSEKTLLDLGVEMYDRDGKHILSPADLSSMKLLWSGVEADEALMQERMTCLERSYIPQFSFPMKKGRHEYFLAFIGAYPIPRPASIHMWATLGGKKLYEEEIALPELQSSAKK